MNFKKLRVFVATALQQKEIIILYFHNADKYKSIKRNPPAPAQLH